MAEEKNTKSTKKNVKEEATTKKVTTKQTSTKQSTAKKNTTRQIAKQKTSTKKTTGNTNKTINTNKTTQNAKKSNIAKTTRVSKSMETSEATLEQPKTQKLETEKVEDKKQLAKKEMGQLSEFIEKEIKNRKSIPTEEINKIYYEVFKNICIAMAIVIFLNFIILGFKNISNEVFLVDLKVFSLFILLVAIGIFEYAYKKDSGKLAINGMEILVLSLAILGFIYLNIMLSNKFIPIVTLTIYVFSIYYVAKSIIVYNKMKKKYFINSMKEMIKEKKED